MFGTATNALAVIGVCAVVFWIICWLVLSSKSDFIPGFLQSANSALAVILAFCTAIPSALLALPLWLLYRQAHAEISRREYRRGLEEKLSESSRQIKDAYASGFRAAEKEFHSKYDRFIESKNRELYEARKAIGEDRHV